jgi:hypothetical protein
MAGGRPRTLLSWTSYFKDEPEHPDDARDGLWSRARLEAMDRKFVARLERAIERGEEHAPTSTSARERL